MLQICGMQLIFDLLTQTPIYSVIAGHCKFSVFLFSFAEKEDLAPVIYVQSDCGTPSDRDNLVKMLSKHIKVDSYGTCEHNKDLPKQ